MITSNLKDSTWVKGVNSLRFILALIVLLSHFENPLINEFKGSPFLFIKIVGSIIGILFNGVAAVIAFFIISGFVIHQSSKKKDIEWKSFMAKRYLRILLPLAVVCLLGNNFNHPEKDILWSLICELIYYTLYPIFRKMDLSWKRLFSLSFALSGIIIITFGYHDLLAFFRQSNIDYHGHYWQFGISTTWIIGLPCWLLGVLISEKENFQVYISTKKIVTYRIVVFAISVVLNYLNFHGHLSYLISMNFFAIILYYWIQNEIAYYKTHKPVSILEKLGKFSYSIYILHPVCYAFIAQKLNLSFVNYLITISITILFCYIFYLIIERPAHLLSKKI